MLVGASAQPLQPSSLPAFLGFLSAPNGANSATKDHWGGHFFFFLKVGERESDCKNGQGFKENLLKDPGATYGKQRVYFHLTASVKGFFFFF